MNNKQLYEKLGQNSYDKVFPITYLQNILDKDTNNDLTVVLSRFNHLWIPYQGTRVNTRKAVPAIFRRNSLTISYYDAEHNLSVTESYIGSNLQAGSGSGAPTAFQAWEKSCEDTLALQGGLYQWALTQQNQRFEDRERLNSELFGVYIDGRNRTDALIEKNNTDHFNLYKYTRDADDDIRKELSDLKAELAVTKAIRPYQDKLIQCEMEKMFTAGINYTDRKTCNVIYGVVTLPNEPTVTGLVGRNACGCLPCGFTQPASGTPAQ